MQQQAPRYGGTRRHSGNGAMRNHHNLDEDGPSRPSPFANGHDGTPSLANLASVFGGSSTDLQKLHSIGSFPSIPQVTNPIRSLDLLILDDDDDDELDSVQTSPLPPFTRQSMPACLPTLLCQMLPSVRGLPTSSKNPPTCKAFRLVVTETSIHRGQPVAA